MKDKKGFSLVEILAGQAVLAITLLGGVGIITYMSRMSTQQDHKRIFFQLQNNLKQTLLSGEAWVNTFNDTGNANLACLRNKTACSTVGAPFQFQLRNAQNQLIYNPIPAANGFNLAGEPCNTYDAGAGNNVCPIKVNLVWTPQCPAVSCVNPGVIVTATFSWNPQSNEMRNMPINIATYNFTIIRGEQVKLNQQLLVVYEENDSSGEGSCSPADSWVLRLLNKVNADEGNNIINKDGSNNLTAGQNFVKLQAGTYHCRVFAPAFRVGAHKVRLTFSGTGAPSTIYGSGAYSSTASTSSTTVAHLEGLFSVTDPTGTDVQVEHLCDTTGMGPKPQFERGVPAPGPPPPPGGNYSGVVYTAFQCVRTL